MQSLWARHVARAAPTECTYQYHKPNVHNLSEEKGTVSVRISLQEDGMLSSWQRLVYTTL